jgi:hypothetical protein
MMIEREADQSRGERESPRPMKPEVVASRIALRVAELRLLAAWCGLRRGSAKSPGRAAQLLVASLPLCGYIRSLESGCKFAAWLSVAKCQELLLGRRVCSPVCLPFDSIATSNGSRGVYRWGAAIHQL